MKTLARRIDLFFLLLVLFATPGWAAEDPAQTGSQELSNPFSDFVPFEDEYDVDEDERFMYFGRFFAVSLGTGVHTFGGNIGKLYNTAVPVLDFRLLYFFDFRLAGQLGISSASHAYVDAEDENAVVNISLFRINADLKYYFDTKNVGAAITMANPYAILGVSRVMRTQNFTSDQTSDSDSAMAVSVGAGMEFALKPRKTSLGVEGRIHQMFFKDRYEDDFATSGIPDRTGNMYSIITSVIFFF